MALDYSGHQALIESLDSHGIDDLLNDISLAGLTQLIFIHPKGVLLKLNVSGE